MASIKSSEEQLDGLSVLAAVEKEMSRGSRNYDGKFSPKIARPKNPLGKLFDSEMDEFSLSLKECEALSTASSMKD